MKRWSLVLLLLSALSIPARAQAWELVGEARLTFLFWSVYDSRLYTLDGQYREGQVPLRLEIQYLLDVSAEDLVSRTLAEWQHQQLRHPQQQQWARQLASIWPDIREGDVLSLELDEEGGNTFYRNGQRLGGVDDAAFGAQFLAIWLSPATSRPEVRLALIGTGS